MNSLLLALLLAEHCGVLKSLNLSLVVKSVSFERLRALNQTLVVKSVSRVRFSLSFFISLASAVREIVWPCA